MKLAEIAVSRPVAVTMRILALVVFGAICVTRLPVDLLPGMAIPIVSVVTTWPNVPPAEIEAQVTRPIEESVGTVPNVSQISSTTMEGSSMVMVQFNWGTSVDQAAVDVLQAIQTARASFPNDPLLQVPSVYKFRASALPILILAVSGEMESVRLGTLLRDEIAPLLESANGVAAAAVTGAPQRAIVVEVDRDRLVARKQSLSGIINRIGQENINLPGGITRQSDSEFRLRTVGWFKDLKQLADLPLGSTNGQVVALRDVAHVEEGTPELRSFARLNGKPAAGLVITKQSAANTITTVEAVMEKVRQIERTYPELKFSVASDQSGFIADSVADVRDNALLGGALAVVILLFFLRSVRSTIVVALSIPISIISTFALFYLCGFSLNTMSLGGLSLATGLIVDDAVVVLENIFRHMERDHRPAAEAAVTGTSEIAVATISSTLTIMVVFLPLLLVQGMAGQLFMQFALVVAFSLAVSLLDALSIVPMMMARFKARPPEEEAAETPRGPLQVLFRGFDRFLTGLEANYSAILRWALAHRPWVLGGIVAATAASAGLGQFIPVEMMPATDTGNFTVNVKMPVGTALARTDRVMQRVEKTLLQHPAVESAFCSVGAPLTLMGTSPSEDSNVGAVMVMLKEQRHQTTKQVTRELERQLSDIPGARISLVPMDLISQIANGGDAGLEFDLYGQDLDTLGQLAEEVLRRVQSIPGCSSAELGWEQAKPELQWAVDREKAAEMGISYSDIGRTLESATGGTIASYFQEAGLQHPIIVRLREAQRTTADELVNLPLSPDLPVELASTAGAAPAFVRLGQVAQPEYGFGPTQITRQNRQRYVSVTVHSTDRPATEIQKDINKALAGLQLPKGYHWEWGLQQRQALQEAASLGFAIILALALIYMLLAAQFESLIHPFTILLTVPLASLGVTLALFFSGRSMGLMTFIGILMLIGIAVKNGILLVDYTNLLREQGMARREALLTAAPTRLRPILMTASAAMLGMLPLALGIGKGAELQASMATAVVGGLFSSTLLTLVVVPVVYSLFDEAAEYLTRRRQQAQVAPELPADRRGPRGR
ncbi:MAG: efflux RND transporter permease subunit [Armatimonadota bacterium]